MNHLSFGRKEEEGLGTRIPSFELLFDYLANLFSIIEMLEGSLVPMSTGDASHPGSNRRWVGAWQAPGQSA